MDSRKFTNTILDLIEDEMVDKDHLITSLLNWMSEYDVKQFYTMYLDDVINAKE